VGGLGTTGSDDVVVEAVDGIEASRGEKLDLTKLKNLGERDPFRTFVSEEVGDAVVTWLD
jgi:hypothetical protein